MKNNIFRWRWIFAFWDCKPISGWQCSRTLRSVVTCLPSITLSNPSAIAVKEVQVLASLLTSLELWLHTLHTCDFKLRCGWIEIENWDFESSPLWLRSRLLSLLEVLDPNSYLKVVGSWPQRWWSRFSRLLQKNGWTWEHLAVQAHEIPGSRHFSHGSSRAEPRTQITTNATSCYSS